MSIAILHNCATKFYYLDSATTCNDDNELLTSIDTKTISVPDESTKEAYYYLAICNDECQSVQLGLSMSSGDAELFAKVDGRPVLTSSGGTPAPCSSTDCPDCTSY